MPAFVGDKKDAVGGGEEDTMACDIQEEELLPLAYMQRAPALVRELLNQTSAGRVISMSPGACDFLLGTMAERMHNTTICTNCEPAASGVASSMTVEGHVEYSVGASRPLRA